MNGWVKVILYLVLVAVAAIFGTLAYSHYSKLMSESATASEAPLTEIPALEVDPSGGDAPGYSLVLSYGGVFFLAVVALGLLIGHEVSSYFGNRAMSMIYDVDDQPISDPAYELAEQQWADGDYLEAIRMMREYLAKHPKEQHVALRIAEIYEKDLNNPLAAALEHEEVLKHKLPPDRWGWAAIHLCNLYFRLGQQDKALALLYRVHNEYGETAAAKKARKKLAEMDPGNFKEPEQEATPEETPEHEPPTGSSSNLPPGFTPKRR